MYLSSRDIQWWIKCGHLIVRPPPEQFNAGYDETSIDLHLGPISAAQVWDIASYTNDNADRGLKGPELGLGLFNWAKFSEKYLISPPPEAASAQERKEQLVCLRGSQVIVKPGGFLLWMTEEWVGTPKTNPNLICFVNAKSTKARTGIIVHFTAPTIHAGWEGYICLEIANMGPFHFVLEPGDAIAQLTVVMISSPPDLSLKKSKSQTAGQTKVSGPPPAS